MATGLQEVVVSLDGFAHGGEAVGSLAVTGDAPQGDQAVSSVAGKRIFVQGALPGERVRALLLSEKKRYAKAKTLEVFEAAEARVQPPCSLAAQCGGCNWQYVDAARQAAFKAEIAENQLRFVCEGVDEVFASPQLLGYRRRARLHVEKGAQGLRIGFYSSSSNEVVPLEACPVLVPELDSVLPWLLELEPLLVDKAQIHLLASQGQVLVGVSGICPPASELSRLRECLEQSPDAVVGLEFRGGRQRLGVGKKRLVLKDAPEGLDLPELRCGPFDFAQAQDEQNRRLVQLVQRHAAKLRGNILELYCGAGNLTRVLRGAGRKVEAWDDAKGSVDALRSWAQAEGQPRVLANQGTALRALRRVKERRRSYELVVVDPPRSGLGAAVVKGLIELGSKHMIYVSCDPATLARDLKLLQEGGYRCKHASMVDMMPMTSEIEMVLKLERV